MARRDKQFMSCFRPEPGCVIAAADVDSAEPAVVAHYAKDERYIFATRSGKGVEPYLDDSGVLMIDDVYIMFGSSHNLSRDITREALDREDWGTEAARQWVVSRIPGADSSNWEKFANQAPEEIQAHINRPVTFVEQWARDSDVVKDWKPLGRPFNKARALALIYGLHINGIIRQEAGRGFHLDRKQAKSIFDGYWQETFPGNLRFKKHITALCKSRGAIVNNFGFRLTPLPAKAFNYLIQSSVSGLVNEFLLIFFGHYAPWCVYHGVIHDEILMSVPIDRQDEAKTLFYKAQDTLNKILGWSVEMTFGWKIRDSLYVK